MTGYMPTDGFMVDIEGLDKGVHLCYTCSSVDGQYIAPFWWYTGDACICAYNFPAGSPCSAGRIWVSASHYYPETKDDASYETENYLLIVMLQFWGYTLYEHAIYWIKEYSEQIDCNNMNQENIPYYGWYCRVYDYEKCDGSSATCKITSL